jgi:hypothetical protein
MRIVIGKEEHMCGKSSGRVAIVAKQHGAMSINHPQAMG